MPVDRRHLDEPLQSLSSLAAEFAPRLNELDRRARQYRDAVGSGAVLQNTLDSIRIELTYNSNAIEGNTLSLRETQLVLEGTTPAGSASHPLREIYEARNHDRALRLVESWASARKGFTGPSEDDLLAIHREVLADIDLANAGRYRTSRVFIAGTRFVPPSNLKFSSLLPRAIELSGDAGVHPVLRAAELHYNLVAIHPFADGNGRTSRLMMNALLLASGYPLVVIEVDRRAEYLRALDEANQGRVEAFGGFVLSATERSLGRILGDTH
ncbi:MAG: Fic family protein [Planctomycetes bacterium]|nr:Fic family protein [Planctomycetota bacterium]